ncbi:hypothetical protein PA6_024_00810 [Aquipseudomonas alcaligenes NBRC 14159]|uniref:Uncharacterized protein n=1 Tax=Aquipseudomonas alcaligenes (strain ATCC 14909 / DSM 50342 / CCUG 1425 / JCM 20561 / NBRC 14159 / NCIMB 9945 / NCTC 10367 / 1577) TaxID=1215092 RepID=U2ZPY1_AQUA1|nr:hypothetical protein PA6_024_00810 [Pseudomonas alcaligenes NBRC 14159]
MWVNGLFLMKVNNFNYTLSMYVTTFDSEAKVIIWKSRVSSKQANEICNSILTGNCPCHSASGFTDWLRADLDVRLENEAPQQAWRIQNNAYSTLCGVFIHGGDWSLDDYCRYGHICETVFGNLKTVSLGWMEAKTEAPFSLIFCH